MRRFYVLAADLFLVTAATICAVVLRDNLELSQARLIELAPYFLATIAAAVVVLPIVGLTRSMWRFSATPDFAHVILASLLIVLGAMGIGFSIDRMQEVARVVPILQGALLMLFLGGARLAVRSFHRVRPRPKAFVIPAVNETDTVLLVGIGPLTELFLVAAEQFAQHHMTIAGIVARKQRHAGRLVQRHRVLGTVEQLTDVLAALEVEGVDVDRIVVTMPPGQLEREELQALIDIETSTSIEVQYLSEALGLHRRTEASLQAGDGAPIAVAFDFDEEDLQRLARRPYWVCKRIIDAGGAAVLVVLFAPVIILVAGLVALDVGQPVLFTQRRPGLGGRPFFLLKFRTMSAGHDASGNRIPDAQRTSRLGAFLRRSRLDELPQLINILFGHMSFIGPRPLLPVDQPPEFAARLMIRPGLTGWAQVEGGRIVSAADKAALDVWYLRHASLSLDTRIFLRTFRMVVSGETVNYASIARAWFDLELQGICKRAEAMRTAERASGPARRVAA